MPSMQNWREQNWSSEKENPDWSRVETMSHSKAAAREGEGVYTIQAATGYRNTAICSSTWDVYWGRF